MARTHGNIVETIKVGEGLRVCFIFDEFFRTTVKETNMLRIGIRSVWVCLR